MRSRIKVSGHRALHLLRHRPVRIQKHRSLSLIAYLRTGLFLASTAPCNHLRARSFVIQLLLVA